jgi:hypothetical protein
MYNDQPPLESVSACKTTILSDNRYWEKMQNTNIFSGLIIIVLEEHQSA